MEIETRQS